MQASTYEQGVGSLRWSRALPRAVQPHEVTGRFSLWLYGTGPRTSALWPTTWWSYVSYVNPGSWKLRKLRAAMAACHIVASVEGWYGSTASLQTT